jgi:adenylosuccinate synthase
VFETLPGWKEEISGAASLADLPKNARRYVERVQELAGTPIATLSVGPAREQTIVLDGVLDRIMSTARRAP